MFFRAMLCSMPHIPRPTYPLTHSLTRTLTRAATAAYSNRSISTIVRRPTAPLRRICSATNGMLGNVREKLFFSSETLETEMTEAQFHPRADETLEDIMDAFEEVFDDMDSDELDVNYAV